MRARLHVHTSEARAPERAARRLTTELLASFPRQRPTTVVLLALGPQPGLTPTPWLLDGVFAALIEAERTPVNFVTIGDSETGETVLRRAGREGPVQGSELIERPNRDRRIELRPSEQRRPLSILRELIGTNVIVCAPLCFAAREQGPGRQWQGPLAAVLSSMAVAHGFSPPTPKLASGLRPRDDDGERAAVTVGHELLEACFAGAALIFDATWAAALELPSMPKFGPTRAPDGRFAKAAQLLRAPESSAPTLLSELAPVDRVLGLADVGRASLAALLGVDRYLLAALGGAALGGAALGHGAALELPPELVHSPGRWPTLSLPAAARGGQTKRLADRAISGLRSQTSRLRGAAEPVALPARVPGEFASVWTQRWYGEHELGRQLLGSVSSRVELG